MARRRLTPLDRAALIDVFPYYRQSILERADNCSLSARFSLEAHPFTTHGQARGIIFHRFAAKLLETLQATGESTIPTQEALEILYEVSRQEDVPPEEVVVLPDRERRLLRIAALILAKQPMNLHRLIAVEKRLYAELSYTTVEGERITRTISGQPDALIADPPNGAVVLDFKTHLAAPPKGEAPHREGDHAHISYGGAFQQRVYALLVMRSYPSVERVTLREWYVFPREARTATVPREALEHIERELADLASLLDRALMAGPDSPLWQPSPGRHCAFCVRPASCPISQEERAKEAGITSLHQAERLAAEFTLLDRRRKDVRDALRDWHDVTGTVIPVKDARRRAELRWGFDSAGKRKFGLYVPEKSDRGTRDVDLTRAFKQAAERRAEAVA